VAGLVVPDVSKGRHNFTFIGQGVQVIPDI